MKIHIDSTKPVQEAWLTDLRGHQYPVKNQALHSVPAGWYELHVPYCGQRLEIRDIQINDCSIRHLIYTGYYTDGQGQRHQPATAVWDTGGVFTIWLHTELGVLFQRMMQTIRNGDYGQNLFERYCLTVDRPEPVADQWPANIRSFFDQGDGPHWWPRDDFRLPWRPAPLDPAEFPADRVVQELQQYLPHQYQLGPGFSTYTLKRLSDLPFIEIADIDNQFVREFVEAIGYRRLIDISLQTLDPGAFIDIHRDDHYNRKAYPYMKGCKKFYWCVQNSQHTKFKLGHSGCIPHHRPLLINTIEHPHSVINQGTEPRISVLVYGDMP
mgnify:FL=1